jgi:SH3 domain protein
MMSEEPRKRGRWKASAVLFLLSLVLFVGSEASAGKLYVSDTTLETILRTGPGLTYRINASVDVGTEVTLLKEEKDWANVALADGRTGWMPRKYLSEEPPRRIVAERLTAENKTLRAEVNQLGRGKQELTEELSRLKKELEGRKQELASVRQAYESLKKGATEYLSLKSAFGEATAEAKEAKEKLQDIQQGYKDLKTSAAIKWFLAGVGALMLGWLLGFLMSRTRRRHDSGLYR